MRADQCFWPSMDLVPVSYHHALVARVQEPLVSNCRLRHIGMRDALAACTCRNSIRDSARWIEKLNGQLMALMLTFMRKMGIFRKCISISFADLATTVFIVLAMSENSNEVVNLSFIVRLLLV